MRLTAATVNKGLKDRGIKERLFKGDGYFYFAQGDAYNWKSSMVCGVHSANDLTLEQWICEYNALKADHE